MPWLPSCLRNWHPNSAGPSPSPNPRTYSPSSLKKHWLITPPVEPSHFNSAVSNDRGVPCTPRRGAHRNSIEGSQRLPSLVRKPGSPVTTIQESSRYPAHLLCANRPGLASLGRAEGRSRHLVLDRTAQPVRKAAVETLRCRHNCTWKSRSFGKNNWSRWLISCTR